MPDRISQQAHRAEYPNLSDKTVLVVEDEPVVAVEYRYQLLEVGAKPAGYLPSNRAAVHFLETHAVDAVIVDHHLADGTSEPLVAWLAAHHVPFLIVSGWAETLRRTEHAPPILEKPAEAVDLWRALSEIVH